MEMKNRMTQQTFRRLQKELAEKQGELEVAGQRMGDAAGQDCDWHDNSAWDASVVDYKVKGDREADIRRRLTEVEILAPREEVDKVGLGNTVVLKFEDQDENEKFTILSTNDSGTHDSWISEETPVGKAVMGKRKGDVVNLESGMEIEVVDILEGEFK